MRKHEKRDGERGGAGEREREGEGGEEGSSSRDPDILKTTLSSLGQMLAQPHLGTCPSSSMEQRSAPSARSAACALLPPAAAAPAALPQTAYAAGGWLQATPKAQENAEILSQQTSLCFKDCSILQLPGDFHSS